jgi:hypothetical protein
MDILGALATGLGALCTFWLTNVYVADRKRWIDGTSLAAALAGELTSYLPAFQILRDELVAIELLANNATAEAQRQGLEQADPASPQPIIHLPAQLFRPPPDLPKDRIYEANINQLGLLGPEVVSMICLVYGNLLGFRTGYWLVMKHGADMASFEVGVRVHSARDALDRARDAGVPLARLLHERARQPYPLGPTAVWQLIRGRSARPAPATVEAERPGARLG